MGSAPFLEVRLWFFTFKAGVGQRFSAGIVEHTRWERGIPFGIG
jgi:hypothetical protein